MKQSVPLLERVAEFMARFSACRPAGVVAVSGGPDSVALVRLLASLQARGDIGRFVLAHLNHQLRAAESDADEAFVQDLTQELSASSPGLICRSQRFDVARLARERGENLESTARQLRYDFLAQMAREEGAAWVATGHTADDQAETVLHRLLRGTGLHGLGGIPARRELAAGIEVVRPLLGTSRAEVLAYLQAEKQAFRLDNSNADLGFTRNRIRHELLPELAHYNPAIVSLLCRLADQAHQVQAIVTAEAAKLLALAELPRAGGLLIFSGTRLKEAPRHLIREMFRLAWRRENWPVAAMDFDDWDRLASLAAGAGQVIDLPDGVRARRTEHVLQVGTA